MTPLPARWQRLGALTAPHPDSSEPRARLVEELARDHEAVLLRMALTLCGNRAEAQDLVQDTFERALRNIERYQPGTNARAWLISIQHNLFIDRCRKKERARTSSLDSNLQIAAIPPEAEPPWMNIGPEQLRAALGELGEEFRETYRLHALEGRSYDDISKTLNVPRSTVGTRLARARRKLKDILLRHIQPPREGEP